MAFLVLSSSRRRAKPGHLRRQKVLFSTSLAFAGNDLRYRGAWMNRITRFVAIAGTALAFLAMAGGVSSATWDPLIGQTYAYALTQVSSWKATAQIETVIGSRLATDDCIVTSWKKSSFLDARGQKQQGVILINLNCNNPLAAPGAPGNSLSSPEGQAQEKLIKTAEWCSQPEQATYKDCAKFCTQDHEGMCTANF
jgi:hypothetical protein